MKRCVKYFVGILLILSILADIKSALALTYSQDIGVSFTFNPVIGLTLSASDLIIPNLSPGTAADSNVIDINILTNNTNGYTLNASVGNDSTYNTRNLIHTNNTVSNTFSSIDIGSNISDKTNLNDNTWAYSYSIDSGTTWTGYNGLPLYSDTTNIAQLKNSTTPVSSASGDNIKFKIAAKASTTQASGEYRNIINFQLTATPLPTTLSMAYANAGKEKLNGYYKLQDMNADICNAAEVLDEGSQMQAIDIRDNKVYWITKLRDGKCWMTQNLDLDLGSIGILTHADTDLGYGNSTTQSWRPDSGDVSYGGFGSDTLWNAGCNLNDDAGFPPCIGVQYYDPGDKIWDGVTAEENEGVGWELDDMVQGTNTHYHVGNYYSWDAATAGAGGFQHEGQVADESICPAGWTLPKGGEYTDNPIVGSFQYMVEQYGWDIFSTHTEPYIWKSPLYFPLVSSWGSDGSYMAHGYLVDGDIGSSGVFWSSKVASNAEQDGGNHQPHNYSMAVYGSDAVSPNAWHLRFYGASARCVSR